ncbi:VPLPA-CTERM sorting domain-containing protein [Roseobacter sinensis]|uniref:VPLPA-CTERM sorting domain-containing protein n=1 Tax=Roseobacter sinensis TaxID=2931391 RepID=A0ABT3BCG1_9RHOB|nr:VPLPA-CTERM sorting domain-containing protein [Roseobacter sp. WL0113]MCV3271242.1 VPLPA-CTERM sorting domain-containing protein [Roseobacter sp. WL0113]
MKILFCAGVLSAVALSAQAATVSVDDGTVRLTGDFEWIPGEGFIDPVRSSAGYTFEMPVAGTPFDPNFSAPPPVGQGSPPVIGDNISVTVGNPQTRDVERSGEARGAVFNWNSPLDPIRRPDGEIIDPQPFRTSQYVDFNGFRYVTDGPDGTSNITTMNFFLNFSEDFSQLTSISATQVIESSIFVPIPGEDPTVATGFLVALGLDEFDPIDVSDVGGGPGEPAPPVTPIPLPAAGWMLVAAIAGLSGFGRMRSRTRRSD